MSFKPRKRNPGKALGFRSGLEDVVAAQIKSVEGAAPYESFKIVYTVPARESKYTPDFQLRNGIIIETKGRFVTADRQKHRLIQSQHPTLDIRFVFTRPNDRISKTSKTTYAAWCEQFGFKYAKGLVPAEWFKERTK